jgi:beta-lactamase superfamily II metal-dependent hydrolase
MSSGRYNSRSSSARLASVLAVTIAAALGAVPARAANTLQIYQIDVEGGGAALVVTPSGQSMLIDFGSPPPASGERDSKRIAAAMQAAGLKKIDYLFTTHYDGDHVGGAVAANNVAHFERFFDHGDVDMKYNQNPGIEDRFKKYLAIAAGKRTIVKRRHDSTYRRAGSSGVERWRSSEKSDQRWRWAQSAVPGRRAA